MTIAERTIIVTGAARNIGLETARSLAALGANVAMIGRSGPALEEAAHAIGGNVATFVGEVTRAEDVARLLDDDGYWRQVSQASTGFIAGNYSVQALWRVLEQALERT